MTFLVGGKDFDYFRTFQSFAAESSNLAIAIAQQLQEICTIVNPTLKIDLPDDLTDPLLYEQIVNLIDALLEAADLKLDEASGKKHEISSIVKLSLAVDKERLLISNIKEIPKPQLQFLSDIDNSRLTPFKPKIKNKTLRELSNDIKDIECIYPSTYYCHPFEIELRDFRYPSEQINEPDVMVSMIDTPISHPFRYIDQEKDLYKLIDELELEKEIALDLEHHSYRSFQGFTCLIQVRIIISTIIIIIIILKLLWFLISYHYFVV